MENICLSANFLVPNDLFFYIKPSFISNLRVKNSNKKIFAKQTDLQVAIILTAD